jgi:thermitase
MSRRAKWGWAIALTLVLTSSLFWQYTPPFPKKPEAGPQPRTNALAVKQAQVMALRAKKRLGNEQIVAKDIARTAALCVRDCRLMLTEISNELLSKRTRAEKLDVLRSHMRMHPQFVSMTLTEENGAPLQVGRVLRPDLQTQAQSFIQRDRFYVSDLYRQPGAKDPKESVSMTVGVPLVGNHHVTGTLTADVEMAHLLRVASGQDKIMNTHTRFAGLDGTNENLDSHTNRSNGGIKARQHNSRQASARVSGTHWRVLTTGHTFKPARNDREYLPDQVLVRFQRDLSQSEIERMSSEIGGNLVRSNSRHAYVFHSDKKNLTDLITYFKQKGAVLAEPHTRLRQNELRILGRDELNPYEEPVVEQPNDVFYGSNQWNLPLIAADKAWQVTTGDENIIIAVIDTGIDLNHPEFNGKLAPGHNMITGGDDPQDDNGHGTHVAGIIAARTNNIEGIAGINWGAKIMPIKAMDAEGSGSVVDIADGIVWAVDHGAKVINLSLGEYNDSDYLHEAIRYAYDKGVVLVAAMGNDGIDEPSYPAAYPEVIAVAANDEYSETATFSNFGSHTSISAPGVAIPSTYPNQRYVAMSGTSMASPHVAGVAGLLLSVSPNLGPADVRKILQMTADDLGPEGKDEYYGYGQVNVARAVQMARTARHETHGDRSQE